MGNILLVSLVSDQTIPNVQIIKEFQKEVTNYLFISTDGMEKKGTRKWIERACGIEEQQRDVIIVKEFSIQDIEQQLSVYDYDRYERIIVNLTGGTKTMTLVASDYFNKIANEIYYVTGRENEYVKIFPQRNNNIHFFNEQISLIDYLTAYGFTVSKSNPSGVPFEQTELLFNAFCGLDTNEYLSEIKFLSERRSANKGVSDMDYYKVERYINDVSYKPQKSRCLSKNEIKYLTGEWFEEYIGYRIKNELNISDDNIIIGRTLTKETPSKVRNDVLKLLNNDELISGDDFNNEMDVMFIYKGVFYSIECKSSIIAYKIIEKNGEIKEKPYNILGETIYKSDSLKNRFGLYPKTIIITLTDFVKYCASSDKSIHHNKIREMETFINRANLSNIKLVDSRMLLNCSKLFDLIK